MVELKTLKDLERPTISLSTGTTTETNFENPFIIAKSEELRQEAIKDIKALRTRHLQFHLPHKDIDESIIPIEEYIKWFFGIKEEDLK